MYIFILLYLFIKKKDMEARGSKNCPCCESIPHRNPIEVSTNLPTDRCRKPDLCPPLPIVHPSRWFPRRHRRPRRRLRGDHGKFVGFEPEKIGFTVTISRNC